MNLAFFTPGVAGVSGRPGRTPKVNEIITQGEIEQYIKYFVDESLTRIIETAYLDYKLNEHIKSEIQRELFQKNDMIQNLVEESNKLGKFRGPMGPPGPPCDIINQTSDIKLERDELRDFEGELGSAGGF